MVENLPSRLLRTRHKGIYVGRVGKGKKKRLGRVCICIATFGCIAGLLNSLIFPMSSPVASSFPSWDLEKNMKKIQIHVLKVPAPGHGVVKPYESV